MKKSILSAIAVECKIIFRNRGVMLIIFLAPLIYSLLYSAGYAKQVLHKVPIAVIDNSHSHNSRQLISMLSASPYLQLSYNPTDMIEAKELLLNREIFGIVYIPNNYSKALIEGKQAVVSIYCDASYFLMYRQVFQGVVSVISTINRRYNTNPAIIYQSHTLFNASLGYGTFIMPAILLVILQQTLLMGIGVVGGVWYKRALYSHFSPITTATAKCIVYGAIYAVTASYLLTLHYHIFGYPTNGTLTAIISVIVPYILSAILLAIALSTLFKRPEAAIMSIIWTSIPTLLLSGASLPTEAFPEWLHIIGKVLPSSSAVPAFIRVQTMGATITEVSTEIVWLWCLVVIYGGCAIVAIKKRMPRRTTKSWTSNLPS